MDIGTSAFTQYEYDGNIVKYLMDNKHLLKLKKGHIHSHNSMTVYFSGTDDDELFSNSANHNIYLSLIVNNFNDMTARVAFRGKEVSKTIVFRNEQGEIVKKHTKGNDSSEELDIVFYHECDITIPSDNGTKRRVSEIMESRKSSVGYWKDDWRKENAYNKGDYGSNVSKYLYEFITYFMRGSKITGDTVTSNLLDFELDLKTMSKGDLSNFVKSRAELALEAYEHQFSWDINYNFFEENAEKAIDKIELMGYNYPKSKEFFVRALKMAISLSKSKKYYNARKK